MTETENTKPPSLLRRLTAILYDSLLVLALVAVVNALALGIVVKASGDDKQLLGAHLVIGQPIVRPRILALDVLEISAIHPEYMIRSETRSQLPYEHSDHCSPAKSQRKREYSSQRMPR